jgi:hypothetical protein
MAFNVGRLTDNKSPALTIFVKYLAEKLQHTKEREPDIQIPVTVQPK